MTTLLLGANGQLGRHLDVEIGGVVRCGRNSGDHRLDLRDTEALLALLDRLSPERVINAAAWTAVDAAEEHEREAFVLNHDLPAVLARWCRQRDALLIHYSTDYVFSGQPGRPWREEDPVAPRSAYGRSKLAGEQAIATSGCRALVLRTAWLYSALPGNFVSAILKRAGQGQPLRVVADQIGSPCWAGTLAQATATLLERSDELDGPVLLHVAGRGQMSWHGLAEQAVQQAAACGIIPAAVEVEAIASDQWPQAASRPEWSVLDTRRYEQMTGHTLPRCADALAECLNRWSKVPC